MSGDCRGPARGPREIGEGEGALLEGFDECDDALGLDNRIDRRLRRRRIVLNGIVVVMLVGPCPTKQVRVARRQPQSKLMLARLAGERTADRPYLANESSDGGGGVVRVARAGGCPRSVRRRRAAGD